MEIVALLLTYALTASIVESNGPWGIFYKLRNNTDLSSFGLLECFMCTSFYTSLCTSLFVSSIYNVDLLSTFAWAWGGSIIIDKSFTYLFTK